MAQWLKVPMDYPVIDLCVTVEATKVLIHGAGVEEDSQSSGQQLICVTNPSNTIKFTRYFQIFKLECVPCGYGKNVNIK
jgi:hypothetical protein